MTPTAPYMKRCITCEDTIDDYPNDFIQYAENNFGNVEDCQIFLRNVKNHNSSTFDNCAICLRLKWRGQQQKYVDKLTELTQERQYSTTPKKNKFISKNYSPYELALSGSIIILLFFIPLITNFILTQFNNYNNNNNISVNEDKLMFTITRLKDQFPSIQHRLLKKIGGAFKRLKTPGEPFVLLLLHDDTNKKTTDCLASYTSVLAKQNIFTNTTKSLWMNASEWTQYSEDSTNQDLIYEKLIVPLKENEVLVLENLQDLPWSVAKSFHHLCDSENPQIAKSMFILELRVNGDGLQQLTDGEKIVMAEQAMMTAWIDAPNSFRQALITRLTSYVDAVMLKSDEECSKELKVQSFIRILP